METLAQKIKEIHEMQDSVNQLRAELRAEAIEKAQEIINGFKLSASDFHFKETTSRSMRNTQTRHVLPKYKGPNGETWTGRGRLPRWLVKLENEGHSINEFLIQN